MENFRFLSFCGFCLFSLQEMKAISYENKRIDSSIRKESKKIN